MCGRYAYYTKIDEFIKEFDVNKVSDKSINEMKNFNIAPTNQVPVIYEFKGERVLKLMHFKLIPHMYSTKEDVKEYCKFTLNAKSETVFDLKSWRRPIRKSRCIIPMNNFYEFTNNPKLSYSVYRYKDKVGAVAGIFDVNDKIFEEAYYSFAIITLPSTKSFNKIHHRQPVFLNKEDYSIWLDRSNMSPEKIISCIKAKELLFHSVDINVRKVSNNNIETAKIYS